MQYLRMAGFLCVERVGTPVISCSPANVPGRFVVVFGEKVSGDVRCVLPGGKGVSVLVETKTTSGPENLAWSQLETHQPQRLTDHAETGAVSLLVWNCPEGIFVMRWPVPGFEKGKGINYAKAKALHVERAEYLLDGNHV